MAYLHEDETEPIAAVSGAARTDAVLLLAGRKRLSQVDSPEVVVAGIAVDELGVLEGEQLLAQEWPGEL